MLVFRLADREMFNYEDDSFYPEPADAHVQLKGINYEITTGARAVAVGPKTSKNSRRIYYASEAG